MHDTRVFLKDGKTFCAPIIQWRPAEGWFSLLCLEGGPPIVIHLRDVAQAWTHERRGNAEDELERARKQGWNGL